MASEVQTYRGDKDNKERHCWQLAVDGSVVAVAPCWYNSEGEMRAALEKAMRALGDARVVERGY